MKVVYLLDDGGEDLPRNVVAQMRVLGGKRGKRKEGSRTTGLARDVEAISFLRPSSI